MDGSEPKSSSAINIAIGLCVLICLGMLGYHFSHQTHVNDDSFNFHCLDIDHEKLAKERASRIETKADLSDKKAVDFEKTVRLANAEQFSTSLNVEEKSKRGFELMYHANQVLELGQLPAFWKVGEKLFSQCNNELEIVLKDLKKGAKITDFRAGEKYLPYREACGDILPFLSEHGLVSDTGEWQHKNTPILVDILNRYRWAFVLNDRKPAWKQLTEYEYLILENWRVSERSGFSPTKRMEYAQIAHDRNKAFPQDLSIAKIHFQEGRYPRALEFLKAAEAKNPKNHEINGLIRYLEKKIENHGIH